MHREWRIDNLQRKPPRQLPRSTLYAYEREPPLSPLGRDSDPSPRLLLSRMNCKRPAIAATLAGSTNGRPLVT